MCRSYVGSDVYFPDHFNSLGRYRTGATHRGLVAGSCRQNNTAQEHHDPADCWCLDLHLQLHICAAVWRGPYFVPSRVRSVDRIAWVSGAGTAHRRDLPGTWQIDVGPEQVQHPFQSAPQSIWPHVHCSLAHYPSWWHIQRNFSALMNDADYSLFAHPIFWVRFYRGRERGVKCQLNGVFSRSTAHISKVDFSSWIEVKLDTDKRVRPKPNQT